jgi:hypothetical protein
MGEKLPIYFELYKEHHKEVARIWTEKCVSQSCRTDIDDAKLSRGLNSLNMQTLFLLLGLLALVSASPVAPVEWSDDVQDGDWTFKQVYDYVLQYNDSTAINIATTIADFVARNNLPWMALYNGNVSIDTGAVVTVKNSAHGRAVWNNQVTIVPNQLATRQVNSSPLPYYGTISAYLWVADCSGDVAYTWTSDSIACVAMWSGNNVERMYSVRMDSRNTGLTITMFMYNENGNTGCKGDPTQVAKFDGSQCIASVDGRGFESVGVYVMKERNVPLIIPLLI